ncbi:MAG: baseplate J/gp47 family protein [Candidatus Saccharimonadales bacterium]
MTTSDKDTIYIDIDDEITGIIDKLHGSKGKIVALVLPKRAGVFQSIVNMKLLKRAADDSKKHLVLITTEAGLLPLAGAAGVHVAKTLNSKPEIPQGPQADDDAEEAIEEEGGEEPEVTAETAGDQPIGKLAGLGATAVAADGVETIELDDDVLPEEAAGAAKPKGSKKSGGKKDKKLRIPDFNRFRLWLILGGLAFILLIFFLIAALSVLPKATINIATDASNINATLNLNLSTTASSLNITDNTVPAKIVQQQKTYTQQMPATGQKNNGNKAQGTVKLTNCSSSAVTIPSGSGFSSGNLTFISTDSVTIPKSSYDNSGHGFVCNNDGNASVDIQAQSGGSSYNVSGGTTFSLSNNPGSVTAQGSASGGTDSIVQIVTQGDINNAKSKISTDDATIKQALQNQLKQDNYYAIPATFSAGTPTVTTSANVGDAASNVTVTEAVTYTMFGARQSDLKKLVDNEVNSQIDTSEQSILSEGLDNATFGVNKNAADSAQLTMQTVAIAGPHLDIDAIKQSAAGKKSGDIKAQLASNPDVTGVDVKLSPFWVNSVPKKTSKIKVVIAKPTNTAKASSTNASQP